MRRRESLADCLFAVDKPRGMTSHDVVNTCRRALHERRVGHAGTLDPDASGVLVLGVGQATRLLGLLTLATKEYRSTFRFGCETTTDDAEGAPVRVAKAPERLADPAVAAALVASLPGDVMQVPPSFSAVSKDGMRAYAAARAGKAVELDARPVSILSAELLGTTVYDSIVSWDLSLEVTKGCYIRSIARDLGRDIGCWAHVCSLRRTASGPVTLCDCLTLDELSHGGVDAVRARSLDPVAVLGLPVRELSDRELQDAACGRRLGAACDAPEVCLVHGDRLHGVWERRGRALVSKTNLVKGVEGVRRASL
ncbi:tRNA pseudouridine(55) synthase TruB [Atopobiaceae bacterium 24-176]